MPKREPKLSRPPKLLPQFAQFPADLREYDQWLLGRFEKAEGTEKGRKMICVANGKPAFWSDASVLLSFAEARSAYEKSAEQIVASRQFSAVYFVLTERDPVAYIDLDECVDDDGCISDFAEEIIQAANSYTELSPSGQGIRIWGYSKFRTHFNNQKQHVEAYTYRKVGSVTGHVIGAVREMSDLSALLEDLTRLHAPPRKEYEKYEGQPIEYQASDDELLAMVFARYPWIKDVYEGSNDNPDESSRDWHLARCLAFYSGNDPHRLVYWMKNSALGREKWSKHRTYLLATCEKAVAAQGGVFFDPLRANHEDYEEEIQIDADGKLYSHFSEVLDRYLKGAYRVEAVPTGIEQIDHWLFKGGLPRGEFTIIAGLSGGGKSTLMLQVASGAVKRRHRVLLFPYEMSMGQIIGRFTGYNLARSIPFWDYESYRMGDAEKMEGLRLLEQIAATDYFVIGNEDGRTSIDIVEKTTMQLVDEGIPPAVVIVDHFDLMSGGKGKSEIEQASDKSRRLKILAKTSKAAFLLLSQVNKTAQYAMERGDEVYGSALRGTGALFHDARLVMMIQNRTRDGQRQLFLKIEKQSYGQSGVEIPLRFENSFYRFEEGKEEEDERYAPPVRRLVHPKF